MTRKRITHASLFSGFGGFDLAAERAGFENLFNCEISLFCRLILNYYFPNAIQYGDIKTTDFTPWCGKIDILTGGFPCQPSSLAGQRKGTDDDRYLWPEMLRAISEIRPTWVIGENVGGIVSMVQPGGEVEVAAQATLFGEDYYTTQERQEFIIERICRDIEHLGYSIQPILIPACSVGAPHRRDRVWFVAHRADTGVEAVRGRRNGVLSAGASADTERFGGREIHDQIQSGQSNGIGVDGNGCERDVTHPESIRSSIAGRTRNRRTAIAGGGSADGKTSQLNPLFVAEMMGFPVNWTVLPFLNGGKNPSKATETPSSHK